VTNRLDIDRLRLLAGWFGATVAPDDPDESISLQKTPHMVGSELRDFLTGISLKCSFNRNFWSVGSGFFNINRESRAQIYF